VSRAGSTRVRWPLLAAWWRRSKLRWASNFLVIDGWVVPAKGEEVFTTLSKHRVRNSAAIAVLTWVLTVNHPVGASLWRMHSLIIWEKTSAGVGITIIWVIETWSCDIEMGSVVAA